MIATETTFPAISVIMGTYNPDKRIEAAVLSIIQQTEKNWELIICDDGSDEKHAKYIESVCCSNSKIRMIRNDSNRGLAYSLNRCLKLSRGEFIARMDDDDISMPDRFTCQLQFLQNNPQYGWVGSQAVLYDEYGDWGVAERPKIPGTKDFLPFSPYIHSSVMFRSDVLKKTKGYMVSDRTRLCEDYELFYRNAVNDLEKAKQTREYGLDIMNHPNWFDASYISWLSYDSLNVELPDGYLHFAPIINWGKYREENGRLMMPVSVRLNHAIADGFLVANVYRLLEKEMIAFCNDEKKL